MMRFFLLALFCLSGWTNSQECPARYLRFTPQHTFCLPPNPSCHIERKGVSQQDKEIILELHNHFRSRIAMGDEYRMVGGSQPQAADMMKMEWDDELANIAQKWTENCKLGHDCKKCREVENFSVGQNVFIKNYSPCNGNGCEEPSDEPDWTRTVVELYDEVMNYQIDRINNFTENLEPKTDHLTQIIWSRSWRIGCGYSFYKHGDTYHKYYACNYGPKGNVKGEPVYKQGRPCSACPINTECYTSRKRGHKLPGLCKMTNPNTAPVYPRRESGLLLLCADWANNEDCYTRQRGKWKTVHSVGGNYESLVLRGGQSATLSFHKIVRPHANAFCLVLSIRKGPLDGSKNDESKVGFVHGMGSTHFPPIDMNIPQTTSFKEFTKTFHKVKEMELTFSFSVPVEASKHIIDIRKVEAYDGPCTENIN